MEPEAARGKNPGSIQRPIRNTGVGSRTHVAWTPESFCYGEKESGYDSLPYSDGRSGHLEPRSEMQGHVGRPRPRDFTGGCALGIAVDGTVKNLPQKAILARGEGHKVGKASFSLRNPCEEVPPEPCLGERVTTTTTPIRSRSYVRTRGQGW